MTGLPDWLTSTIGADVVGSTGVAQLEVRPLRLGQRLAGRVTTVRVAEGDNLGLREARRVGPTAGPILLVHGSPTSRRAVMGEIVAAALQQAGFAGMVTDGMVRDSADIAALGFPVWCRGFTPLGATKVGPFGLGENLQFGGVAVSQGDYLIADDDGLVVWPAGLAPSLLQAAEARRLGDAERLRLAQAGGGLG